MRDGGAAVIASDHVVYRRAITKATGILVKPDEWDEAIRNLNNDHALRHRLQLQGHEWVQKYGDIQQGWRLWAGAYKRIIEYPASCN